MTTVSHFARPRAAKLTNVSHFGGVASRMRGQLLMETISGETIANGDTWYYTILSKTVKYYWTMDPPGA